MLPAFDNFFKLHDSTRPCPRCYVHNACDVQVLQCKFFPEDFFKKPDFFNVFCTQMIEKENQLYISEFVNVQYIYIPLSVTR